MNIVQRKLCRYGGESTVSVKLRLKQSNKFRNIPWTVATAVFLAGSLYLLSLSMVTLPVGTAYAVWTGIGAVGTLLAGTVIFKETAAAIRMFFALLIIVGIVGLQITAVGA